ncbi:zinc finger, CCHC-type containing protein [Tanacetum coccineum]
MDAAAMKHMASNFSKLDKFKGMDFRRWQKNMHFLLSSMSVVYVLTTPIPEDGGDNATVEQIRKRAKMWNLPKNYRIPWRLNIWLRMHQEELTLVELGSHLHIEESSRCRIMTSQKATMLLCGKHGHLKKDCKGGKVGNKANGSGTNGLVDGSTNSLKGQNMFNKSFQVYYVTYVSEAYFVQDDDVAWWVDSGATVHVCKDRCWFKTYESLNDGSILHMGNESTALVHGRGCVDLKFSSGKIVLLFNVLHVPNIRKNLVSSSVLNNCGYKQVIESNKFVLSKHGVFIGFGYLSNQMFRLNNVNDNIASTFMSTSKLNDSILWHARLGHVHFKRMQDMSKDGLIPTFDMDTEKCKTCMLNKITKKPFQNVKRKTEVLELIYSYLCDLHDTPSLGNTKYFVIFIDDASRAVVRLPDPKLKNLAERGIECIFVGYSEHSKAFRFYVIEPNDSVVQQPKPELRKSKRNRTPKDFGPEFQLYLIKGTRDEKETINDEMDSIMGNNTWVLAVLPLGCKALGCKWIFKRKLKVDGTIENFKARLVIQGFKQKSRIDYFDTYAPVARISTIRLLIAMASIQNLIIHQMDVDLTKEFLSSRFSMKDMGEADVILGIRIKHEINWIAIYQSHYIEKVLKKFNYFDCTPVSTPMDISEKLMPNNSQAVYQLKYSRVIDCLKYAMTCIRPDIAFVVGKLSMYTSNLGTQHWQAIQQVLKYLKKTMDYRLTYIGYPSVLEGYTDASWISNTKDNSSTSGWVKSIAPVFIRCDSVVTLAKAYSQMYNGKSRHLGVRHSMIRELITNGVISIEFVRSQQNLADHLTKGLARDLVIKSAERMGLKLLPSWIDTSYSVRFLMTIDMSLFGASLLAVTFTLANPNSRSRPMALIKELSRPHMCQQNSFEDISGKVVADFGCGCGTLGLAATLLDADFVFDSHVIGVDRDEDSLEIASINADDLEVEMELIQCQINNLKWRGQIVDTVVMNPPFGTRNKGVDMEFLSVVLKVASQAVYSLHKTTTREHIKRAALRDYNAASAELRYDLPKLYKFHKKKVVDIAVDLCRFVPKT